MGLARGKFPDETAVDFFIDVLKTIVWSGVVFLSVFVVFIMSSHKWWISVKDLRGLSWVKFEK